MTATVETPDRGNPTPAALSLDLVYGHRPETRCSACDRPMPAIGERFELEDVHSGEPLCDPCSNRHHKGLRLAVALLNQALDDRATGNWRHAEESLWAVFNGLEILGETPKKPATARPVQNRASRRAQRRRGR